MTALTKEDLRRLRDVATNYKRMILLVAVEWVCSAVANSQTGLAVPVLLGLLAVAAACALVVSSYRLAGALESSVPLLWAIGMFIPFLNLIVLLLLSRRAQAACRKHGVKVGLIGPDEADLLRLDHAFEATEAARLAQAAYAAQAGGHPSAPR